MAPSNPWLVVSRPLTVHHTAEMKKTHVICFTSEDVDMSMEYALFVSNTSMSDFKIYLN